jgi:hypothetical protein
MRLDFSMIPQDEVIRASVIDSLEPSDALMCGWIPPAERDSQAQKTSDAWEATLPDFAIIGKSSNENATKVYLWETWSKAFPGGYPGIRQVTGSCVGAGGGNALFTLACCDVVRRGDPERVEIPFWLLPYGKSRELAGLRGRGEGSWGTTFARAVREIGHIPANTEGLPRFDNNNGLVWGRETEYTWSDGSKIERRWLDLSRPHLVKTTSKCRSTDDVREAIKNGYPVTIASNWGGLMQCPVEHGRLMNRRRGTWMHQMSIHGWEDHPQLGEIWYVLNQWGLNAHGTCPSGAPRGGFWIGRRDLAEIVSQGETFAFSEFDGFPAAPPSLSFDLV